AESPAASDRSDAPEYPPRRQPVARLAAPDRSSRSQAGRPVGRGVRQVRKQDQRRSTTEWPMRRQHSPFAERRPERRIGEAGHNLALPDTQEVAHKRQSLAALRRTPPVPIELGGEKGRLRERIGDGLTELGIGRLEL